MLIKAINQNCKSYSFSNNNKNTLNTATKPRTKSEMFFKGKPIPEDISKAIEPVAAALKQKAPKPTKRKTKSFIKILDEGIRNLFKEIKYWIPTKTNRSIKKGLKSFEKGKIKEAKKFFDKAVEAGPENPHALYHRGSFYVAVGKNAKALADLNKSIELEPENLDNFFLRSIAYMNLEQYKEAKVNLNKVLKQKPQDLEVLLHKAELQEKMGEIYKSIRTCNKIIKRSPNAIAALGKRAVLYNRIEKTGLGDKDFKKICKINAHNLDESIDKGRAFLALNKNFEAMEEFKRALADKPKDPAVILSDMGDACTQEALKGDPLFKDKFIKKALTFYQKGIDANPEDKANLWSRYNLYMNLDKPEKAIDDIDALIKIDPEDLDALNEKVELHRNMGDMDSVIQCYERIIEIDPSDLYSRLNLASAYADAGDKVNAIKHYNEVLKVDSESEIAEVAYASKGCVYTDMEQDQMALDNFRSALKINPRNPLCYANRAMIYSEHYNNELALKNIRAAVQFSKDPNAVEVPELANIEMVISKRIENEEKGLHLLYQRGGAELIGTEDIQSHSSNPEDLLKDEKPKEYNPDELLKEDPYIPWDSKTDLGTSPKDPKAPWKDLENDDVDPDDLQTI